MAEARMRIKSRFLGLIFIAAVIVPSILLAVLSIRAAGREEAFVEKQLATTLLAEITQTAGLANAEIGRIVDELRSGIEVPAGGDYAPALRRWQKSSPLVGVPFLLSPRYGILWPRADNSASDAEKRFLRENGDFLSDKTATTVLQNIALRYRQEILAEAPTRSEAAPVSDTASRQRALDAFAQSPEIQSKVYEEAREQGDLVSPRVAQPLSKMSQNAAPAPSASGASTPGAFDADASVGGASAPGVEAPSDMKESASVKKDAAPSGPAPATVPVVAEQQSQFVVTSRLLSQISSQGEYGLIPRFMGDKLTFLFWERQRDGRIAGCEIAVSVLRDRIAGVLSGTYTPVRIITILDETGAPLASPPESEGRNWRLPFVSREIGESLPRWEAAGYLTRPDSISSRARSSSLIIAVMVFILFVSVAGGGTMVLTSVYGEVRLAQRKATFVTNVSHELKTPLTSISLFVELLRQKRQANPAKREQYLSLIAAESERLTRLINNVLDFSSQERGVKRYAMRRLDAAVAVEEIVEGQRMRLESRGFTVRFSSAKGPALVRADPESLKQILLNLLSNAEKYSPARKEIEVEVAKAADAGAREPAWVLTHVRDRGIGIAEQNRERIFREFFRVDDSLASRVQGSGLGLTIARRIARDQGGDLACESREGGGSDFIVRLPEDDTGSEEQRS
jgi:two-component system phosphate regulon sensor histidine kinase PhoR